MKDGIGSIRTGIQGQSGGEVAAAGERGVGSGRAGSLRRTPLKGSTLDRKSTGVETAIDFA